MNPATIYEKFLNGKEISDEEIKFGIEHFCKLAEMLRQSGREFSIVAAECLSVARFLENCKEYREHGK